MKKVIIVLASLLMVSIAGISIATSTSGTSTSSSSYDNRTFDQQMADWDNVTMVLELTIGRSAGRAEMLGQLDARYSREDVGDYNKCLKLLCNESRYNELKIKYPDA